MRYIRLVCSIHSSKGEEVFGVWSLRVALEKSQQYKLHISDAGERTDRMWRSFGWMRADSNISRSFRTSARVRCRECQSMPWKSYLSPCRSSRVIVFGSCMLSKSEMGSCLGARRWKKEEMSMNMYLFCTMMSSSCMPTSKSSSCWLSGVLARAADEMACSGSMLRDSRTVACWSRAS